MKSQRDMPKPDAEPGVETDALRLSDIAGDDRPELYEAEIHDDLPVPASEGRTARIVMIAAVVGIAAAAAVGAKIAYDRRKSAQGYRKAVEYLDDAREALLTAAAELPDRGREVLSAAAELPERGREALQRVRHR
ncbi:hypothetical protein [Glycomyces sp. NPDC048151]|uniref:hypothetical protein n=1 Tax=Glycomyces sp. NPDC048151 TaxID=3364002 RepID=UPI0037153CBB